jgi:predicted amidohydrolase
VKAYQHYPEIARHFSMPIVMANSIGYCDNFESVGGSAAWSKEGLLLGKLNGQQEGILLVDTLTNAVIKKIISI